MRQFTVDKEKGVTEWKEYCKFLNLVWREEGLDFQRQHLSKRSTETVGVTTTQNAYLKQNPRTHPIS